MTDLRVLGIDPGPTPGLVLLDLHESRVVACEALQCTRRLLPGVLDQLVRSADTPVLVQVERFVVGRRASRSSTARAGEVTRELVGAIASDLLGTDARMVQRSASAVKPWATDVRLQRALAPGDTSLYLRTAGMQHARDAARHALFAAVHDGGLPDPLSKEYVR